MAVSDSTGKYGFASGVGVQLFRDGKIVAGPGENGPLSKSLVGTTREAIIKSFEEIANS